MTQAWARKASSFQEAEELDWRDYLAMTPAERLSVLQQLREEYDKLGGRHARRERLRRVARVVQPA